MEISKHLVLKHILSYKFSIHFFFIQQYLLNAYNGPGMLLGARDTTVNKCVLANAGDKGCIFEKTVKLTKF